MNTFVKELCHYGIKGQQWGVMNGPPYPLSGGQFSPSEIKSRSHNKKTIKKKTEDTSIKAGTSIATLSYDPDRTKGADMFYGAYTFKDKHEYNALFNRAVKESVYDQDGNAVGTKNLYKFRIENVPKRDLKIASENSSAEQFAKLYSKDRDFYNYVTDPERMQKLFVEDKYKFKGYRESRDVLQKLRDDPEYTPTKQDIFTIYRMFNYVIPNTDSDTMKQRKKLFDELKKNGYDGILDTNDALYGGFKAENPVIIINQEALLPPTATRTNAKDVRLSAAIFPLIKLTQ